MPRNPDPEPNEKPAVVAAKEESPEPTPGNASEGLVHDQRVTDSEQKAHVKAEADKRQLGRQEVRQEERREERQDDDKDRKEAGPGRKEPERKDRDERGRR